MTASEYEARRERKIKKEFDLLLKSAKVLLSKGANPRQTKSKNEY